MSSETPASAGDLPASVRPAEQRAVSRNARRPGGPREFFRYHGIRAPGVRRSHVETFRIDARAADATAGATS